MLAGLLLLGPPIGCGRSSEPAGLVSWTGRTMGTSYQIHVVRPPDQAGRAWDVQQLQQEVARRLVRVNDQMSTYQPDSELSRFNSSRGAEWFPVSPETAQVVHRALDFSRRSQGAFDVTVGPLVNLWGFGPGSRRGGSGGPPAADLSADQSAAPGLPTDEAVAAALATTGFQHLEVRLDPPALRKAVPELYVDLSAIAKGHGVDVVGQLLEQAGIGNYMVEIGGEVRTRGSKPADQPWRIGVEAPLPESRSVYRALELRDASLATSGDYRNFFLYAGRRLSHTIDPRTGRPTEHELTAVSVLAESCMDADAWATTFMVLGPDAAYNLAEREGISALLLVRSGDTFRERPTSHFSRQFPGD